MEQAPNMLASPKAYRQLSPEELALMDKINAHREITKALCDEVRSFVGTRSVYFTDSDSGPQRAASIGVTELQAGFMWLVRAVAAPSFF